jgi:hypothetical protein
MSSTVAAAAARAVRHRDRNIVTNPIPSPMNTPRVNEAATPKDKQPIAASNRRRPRGGAPPKAHHATATTNNSIWHSPNVSGREKNPCARFFASIRVN